MINDAEKKGLLKPGATIIEPTSGNTGIGIASAAASKGYKVILTMPETMSVERRNLLKAYGAKVVITEGSKGMQGAIDKAEELLNEIEGSFIAGQFDNPANPKIHYETTGPEIYKDLDGNVDIFIAGIGANFVPSVLDTNIYDEILTVSEKDAYEKGRLIASKEGFLVGITSGAAVHGAITCALRPENKDKVIVAFLPDTGDRYLSTPMFSE